MNLARLNSLSLAKLAAQAALEKKAEEVTILDLRKMDTITDFFVICTGQVDQQVKAIAEHVEERVMEASGQRVLHREGRTTLNWVLLDYVDVVVHVFRPAFREFYKLEHLWGDADVISVSDEAVVSKPRASRKANTASAATERKPKVRNSAKADTNEKKSPARLRSKSPSARSVKKPRVSPGTGKASSAKSSTDASKPAKTRSRRAP